MWAEKLMTWLRYVEDVIVLNLLFIAGSLAGILVLGVQPAMAAVMDTVPLIKRETTTAGMLVRNFYQCYRQSFKPLLPYSVLFTVLTIALYFDWRILLWQHGTMMSLMLLPLTLVTGYVLIVNLLAVQLVSPLEGKRVQALRVALIMPFAHIVKCISIVVIALVMALLTFRWPILMVFGQYSLPLILTVFLGYDKTMYLEIERKAGTHLDN